jgi:hypothetical protein
MADTLNACFSAAKIKDFLFLEIKRALPLLPGTHSSSIGWKGNPLLEKSNYANQAFIGLNIEEALVNFKIVELEKELFFEGSSQSMQASGLWVSGTINIVCEKLNEDKYAYKSKNAKFEFSLQNLKKEWLKNGMSRIETEYNPNLKHLVLSFFVE